MDELRRPGKKDKRVRVGRTRVGKGVFSQRRYAAQAAIGRIEGEVIDDSNYESDYCFDLEDGRRLEPVSPFRFVNHSCEPNCAFDFCDVPASGGADVERQVHLFALREIKPGEELTIDYNWPARSSIPCRCQAETCRGWIVAPSQLEKLGAANE